VATRKRRVPLDPDSSDEVLFASDYTCCVCRNPEREVLQIHHIDGDPSNNEFDNLAALCGECHHKTQVRGGFGKQLSPGLVQRYRDDWLERIDERRAKQAGQNVEMTIRQPERKMSPQQAREHAQRLRSLYKSLLASVQDLQSYVAWMCARPFESETLDARTERLKPYHDAALKKIWSTLADIRIEPGSQAVCDNLNSVFTYARNTLDALAKGYEKHGWWRNFSLSSCEGAFNGAVRDLRIAIHAHIQSIDDLT
jgi:hypothetical protein